MIMLNLTRPAGRVTANSALKDGVCAAYPPPRPRRAIMNPVDSEDPDRFIQTAKFDWLVLHSWRYLHTVRDTEWTDAHRADMAELWAVETPVRLACGRTAGALCIPGFGSRLTLPRCTQCCRALGGPAGIGSPKNDDRWRTLLGLD